MHLTKSYDAVKNYMGTIQVKFQTFKTLEFLKQIPRWVERMARAYLFWENLVLDRVVQRFLATCAETDIRDECLRILVQVMLTYFFLTFDLLSMEMLDAIFNGGIPSDRPEDYLTVDVYLKATSLQLDQLASGDMSLLTEDQLRSFEQRYEVYDQREKVFASKWYFVRIDLIIIAVVVFSGICS